MSAADVVHRFVEAVNRADLETITGLMAENHQFIDSDGSETRGRQAMRERWIAYFEMMPDYRIGVLEAFAQGQTVVLVGRATGTYAPDGRLVTKNRWEVSAAWRAVVKGDQIAIWQVFVNPEPIRRAMQAGRTGVT